MIAHNRAVQPAAQPRLVTRLGLAARLQLVLLAHAFTLETFTVLTGWTFARWVTKRVSKLKHIKVLARLLKV